MKNNVKNLQSFGSIIVSTAAPPTQKDWFHCNLPTTLLLNMKTILKSRWCLFEGKIKINVPENERFQDKQDE